MIPVFINTFNRLNTTRKLVDQVAALTNAKPIVIDNASTWGPLLEWYESCPCEVIRLRENLGHHAPWMSGVISQDDSDFYAVTDCDLDLDGIPCDAISRLIEPLVWYKSVIIKSGFGLRIDDLPEWQNSVRRWESQWWRRPLSKDERFYRAAIDTTFALYRRDTPHDLATKVVGVPCVRSGYPYVARHVPWYLDGENLDEENANYFATANSSNSWRPNGRHLAAPY